MRHSLTLGELAQFCNASLAINADLEIVPLSGWQRSFHLPETSAPWCPPSPNMPRYDSALVYPGQVLLEGTNLSEGRGTTTPFEIVGAPFIDSERLALELNSSLLNTAHVNTAQLNFGAVPSVYFRPLRFVPTFDKWAGQSCGGVFIHPVDRKQFRSYSTTIEILRAVKRLYASEFAWLPPPYEYEFEKPPIDILSGSEHLRKAIDASDDRAISDCTRVDQSAWWRSTESIRIY